MTTTSRGAWGRPLQTPASGNHRVTSTAATATATPTKVQSNHSVHSEDDSDSGEDGEMRTTDVETLQASIFGGYGGGGIDASDFMNDTGVAKIRGILVAGQSGGMACLICLERVKGTDFVWDCKAGCFAIFHLPCIQSWAMQSLNTAELRALSRLSEENFPGAAAAVAAHWYCPKCRAEYSRMQIPKEYHCFCRKEVNPAADPWLAPHTCGEKCGLELEGQCGHECKLLCHPGPCPACPQLVKAACFCGEESKVRRCGRRNFSCGGICRRSLACGKHACQNVCHGGDCPPCNRTGMYSCRCKTETAVRVCTDSDFQCERQCGKELSCKKHSCEKGCHSGSCGECELSGRRTCPCGKMEYKGVACDKSVPTCGSTCERVLGCSVHKCQERCHSGPCNSTCRVMLTKACQCGSLKKEVPCYQDLMCERKCQRLRDCARHACRKRCCDGNCPSCSEVCGRKLRCGNHKCPAPCHRGVCAPCPVSVRISCACGETSFEVPCGMERDQKPPRCSKRCQIPQACSHGTQCKPHLCHYGGCPPCQLTCDSELNCGHKCPQRCHGPRPVPNPDYTLKPKKKKAWVDDSWRLGVPCPPCLEPVVKQCLGQHYGIEKTMVCSAVTEFQCENPCGNSLLCGNHFCSRPCHPVQAVHLTGKIKSQTQIGQRKKSKDGPAGSDCDQCHLPCQKDRTSCSHPCPLPCHPGGCGPCKALVKKGCYCETLVHVFDCDAITSSSESAWTKMLSCGGPCHRKLPNCTHMCSDICHPGNCKMATNCHKKVVVRCACQRLKKEWPCLEVQAALSSHHHDAKSMRSGVFNGLIPCDQKCLKLAAAKEAQEEAEQLRQRKGKELEVTEVPRSTGRRRKQRHHMDSQHSSTRWQEIQLGLRRWLIIISIAVLVLLTVYLTFMGLQELNAWFNRREAARLRRKPQFGSRQGVRQQL